MARGLITGAVSGFNPSLRNIDLSGISSFDIRRLNKITHEKTNTPVYLKDAPGRGYTALTGSVVTLAYDTSAMSANDTFSVIYDDPAAPALPAGAATAASQSAQTAALTAANQRTAYFSEANNVAVAANGAAGGTTARDAGAAPSAYTKLNGYFYSTQSGTASILGSDDNVNFFAVYNQSMTAGTPYAVTLPILFRYYYLKVANGGTAASITVKGSFSTN